YQDNDPYSPSLLSPSNSRPLTTSSRGSTASSLGSIPDFPVPTIAQARRSANIGPPPSARRGPSSYYSQASFVSPIVEESEGTRSHQSYASSMAIPIADPDFRFAESPRSDDDDEPPVTGDSDDGRFSRASDHNDQSGLVRQASLGRRQKPSLVTTKSGEFSRQEKDKASRKKGGIVGQAAVSIGAAGGAVAAGLGASRENTSSPTSLSGGTGLLDSSSSSSETLDMMQKETGFLKGDVYSAPFSRSRSPAAPVDRDVELIIGGLEKGGALDSETAKDFMSPQRQSSLAERVGNRRPPRLDVDAVKDPEARGSLTSLPDLIRRATRLAANLDRGKTASRLGMDLFIDPNFEKQGGTPERRSGSLSDILASFPPPGLATPTGNMTPTRPISRWPSSGLAIGQSASEQGEEGTSRSKRRCCGMPLWAFILLMIILLLLVAAAVVIPIVLIVLPKQRENGNAGALAACERDVSCQNGGVSTVLGGNTCSCLCANGFTGDRCTTAPDSGCTTANVAGLSEATIGSSIPRLLEDAQQNFSIPLNASLLLSLFSSNSLSCQSENALVTFNGLSGRSVEPFAVPLLAADPDLRSPHSASATIELNPMITPAPTIVLAERQDGIPDAVTSNGIIFAASSDITVPASISTEATSTSLSDVPSMNKTIVDFARVGVLFVLQTSRDLDLAVTAQTRLQSFLLSNTENLGSSAKNISLDNGFGINLIDLQFRVPNGT
ncbi:hypothetical protein M501DRAFT_913348, partial [Patellaria atrata CBS 101060]